MKKQGMSVHLFIYIFYIFFTNIGLSHFLLHLFLAILCIYGQLFPNHHSNWLFMMYNSYWFKYIYLLIIQHIRLIRSNNLMDYLWSYRVSIWQNSFIKVSLFNYETNKYSIKKFRNVGKKLPQRQRTTVIIILLVSFFIPFIIT